MKILTNPVKKRPFTELEKESYKNHEDWIDIKVPNGLNYDDLLKLLNIEKNTSEEKLFLFENNIKNTKEIEGKEIFYKKGKLKGFFFPIDDFVKTTNKNYSHGELTKHSFYNHNNNDQINEESIGSLNYQYDIDNKSNESKNNLHNLINETSNNKPSLKLLAEELVDDLPVSINLGVNNKYSQSQFIYSARISKYKPEPNNPLPESFFQSNNQFIREDIEAIESLANQTNLIFTHSAGNNKNLIDPLDTARGLITVKSKNPNTANHIYVDATETGKIEYKNESIEECSSVASAVYNAKTLTQKIIGNSQ